MTTTEPSVEALRDRLRHDLTLLRAAYAHYDCVPDKKASLHFTLPELHELCRILEKDTAERDAAFRRGVEDAKQVAKGYHDDAHRLLEVRIVAGAIADAIGALAPPQEGS